MLDDLVAAAVFLGPAINKVVAVLSRHVGQEEAVCVEAKR